MTQEPFSSSVLIENKQIQKQLSEYSSNTTAAMPMEKGKTADYPAQSGSVAVVPSALDCGILVSNDKVSAVGFVPSGARGPVLSRPALAPPSKPRSNPQCAVGRRGRRGSGTGNVRGGRVPMQKPQEQPTHKQQNDMDCAILVPSGIDTRTTSAAHLPVLACFAILGDLPWVLAEAMANAIPEAPVGFAGMRGGSSVPLAVMPKSLENAGVSGQALPLLKSRMPSLLPCTSVILHGTASALMASGFTVAPENVADSRARVLWRVARISCSCQRTSGIGRRDQ